MAGMSTSPDVTHHGELDHLHALLIQLIRAAGLLQANQGSVSHATDSLSLSQGFAITELMADAPLAQRDLAERLNLEKSTVSRIVADLEQRGLITRDRDRDNVRLNQLRLTKNGRDTGLKLAARYRAQHSRILRALSEEERDALSLGLTALLRELHAEHGRAASGHD
jgi:DNA-binding MarR family transcriptional regulator